MGGASVSAADARTTDVAGMQIEGDIIPVSCLPLMMAIVCVLDFAVPSGDALPVGIGHNLSTRVGSLQI